MLGLYRPEVSMLSYLAYYHTLMWVVWEGPIAADGRVPSVLRAAEAAAAISTICSVERYWPHLTSFYFLLHWSGPYHCAMSVGMVCSFRRLWKFTSNSFLRNSRILG